MKKISVIIPIYNRENYLKQCIESVINQTYKNLEIILVDDGSKDKSLEICNQYKEKDNRIVVFHQENQGVSAARNSGLNFITGDYVYFIDSDDWIENNMLEVLVKNMELNKGDLSICSSIFESVKTKNARQPKKINIYLFSQTKTMKEMLVTNKFNGSLCNKLYKKELLGNLKFDTSISFGEDLFFNYSYLKNCKKVVYTNQVLYHYIKSQGSIVRSKFNTKKLSLLKCVELIIEDSKKNFADVVDYAKGLYALHNLEILYYIIRDKYKDKNLKNKLKQNLKQNLKYVTRNKDFRLLYRLFLPFAYAIVKFL